MRKLLAKMKGWRTVIVGSLVGIPLAALQLLEAFQVIDVKEILPEPWGSRVALAIAVTMILLRLITSGPVGAKEEEE